MNNTQWFEFSVALNILFVIILLIAAYRICTQFETIMYQKQSLHYWESTYLTKQGATSLWKGANGQLVCYLLKSLDGGKNWYAIERNVTTDEIIILGTAEQIYPGLLKHINNWNNLSQQVEKNDPLEIVLE